MSSKKHCLTNKSISSVFVLLSYIYIYYISVHFIMLNNVNKTCYFIEATFIEKKVSVFFAHVNSQEIIHIWKHASRNRFRLKVHVFQCKHEKYMFRLDICDLFKNQR